MWNKIDSGYCTLISPAEKIEGKEGIEVDDEFWARRIISGDKICPGRPEMWITKKIPIP